jgi:hypothetical protein
VRALRRRALRAVALLGLGLGAGAPGRAAAAIELLHVEANEGGSSGGHAALRFGAATFHFLNAGGLLLLEREDSRRFVHDYALLQNRPIHVRALEAPPEVERAARERLQARLAAQRSQLEGLAALRAERELLALLLRLSRGEALPERGGLAIPGAGYFEPAGAGYFEPAGARADADPDLAELRASALRERGLDFFAQRRRALRTELARLAPGPEPGPAMRLEADAPLPLRYGFGTRYADLAAGLVALEVLDDARALRADALRRVEGPPLAPEARRELAAFADRLRSSLLRLLDGSRPDWGRALLVGMARLAAARASLRDGHLRVLDAYAEGAAQLPPADLARRRDLLPAIAAETGALAEAALRSFVARRGSQASWSDVEDATNRHLEVLGAWREGRALRAQRERLVPARSAPLRALVPLRTAPAELARALAAAEERERELAREVERIHGYDLVRHNCVSELLATLDAAWAAAAPLSAAPEGRGAAALDFIPFVAAARAARRYGVAEVSTIPSLRHARLARLRAAEGALRAALRESSPLTARAGRPGTRDSFFLFFTDRLFWPRPLLGAANLAAGAGQAAVGLLRAPWDGGRTLARGLRGALMSLPELAFVSLRKGTHDWVPRDAVAEIGLAAPAAPPGSRISSELASVAPPGP